METNRFITKGSLALASLLMFAAPAFPSSITMNFDTLFTAANTGITTSGTTVTKFGAVLSSGTLGGFAESGLTLTDVSNTWTLAGTWDGVNSTSLLVFTNTPTNNAGTSVASYGGTTTLSSINSSLATALGIVSSGDSIAINSGSLNYSGGTGPVTVNGVSYASTVTSPTLLMTLSGTALPTPEPASFFLMGSALLAAGMVFKSRRAAVKPLA